MHAIIMCFDWEGGNGCEIKIKSNAYGGLPICWQTAETAHCLPWSGLDF